MSIKRGPYKKEAPKRNCNLHVRVTQDCIDNIERIISTNTKYKVQADLIEDCILRMAHLEAKRLEQIQKFAPVKHAIDEKGNVSYLQIDKQSITYRAYKAICRYFTG